MSLSEASPATRGRIAGKLPVVILVLGVVLVAMVAAAIRLDVPAATLENEWAGPPSQFTTVGGLRTHFRDRGQGPVIVMLHGAAASLFAWEGWAEALAPHYRVVTLDLPGHGLTGPDPLQRYAPDKMADFLDQFVQDRRLERFTLVGHSLGGNVAWQYTVAHPERVERLVLVDAAGYPRQEPAPLPLRMQSSPVMGRLVRWMTPRGMFAASVRDMFGDPARATDGLIEQAYELVLRDGNREATRLRYAQGAPDVSTRIREIKAPTLILWGARDHWILPRYGEKFAQDIPGSRLVKLEGLGHIPMVEDPERSLQPVLAFLASPGR